MTPLKTNPAYAHLAYRKAITLRVASFLHRQFLGDERTTAVEVLTSDEVFPADAVVPLEEIQKYIESLMEEEASLTLQLGRFALTEEVRNEPQATQSSKAQGRRSRRARRH